MTHSSIRATVAALVLAAAAAAAVTPLAAGATEPVIQDLAPTRGLAGAERLHPPEPATEARPAVARVVDLVNAERSRRGLAPLRSDARLGTAAQRHSEDQARRGRMSHTGSDGSSAGDRIRRAGYVWRSWAENVAHGYSSPEAVVAGWMNSPGHRRNILSANVDTGVGVAIGADGRTYWTQVFATPA